MLIQQNQRDVERIPLRARFREHTRDQDFAARPRRRQHPGPIQDRLRSHVRGTRHRAHPHAADLCGAAAASDAGDYSRSIEGVIGNI